MCPSTTDCCQVAVALDANQCEPFGLTDYCYCYHYYRSGEQMHDRADYLVAEQHQQQMDFYSTCNGSQDFHQANSNRRQEPQQQQHLREPHRLQQVSSSLASYLPAVDSLGFGGAQVALTAAASRQQVEEMLKCK